MDRYDIIDLITMLQRALALDERDMLPITTVCAIKKKYPHIDLIIGDYGITKLSAQSFNVERDAYGSHSIAPSSSSVRSPSAHS